MRGLLPYALVALGGALGAVTRFAVGAFIASRASPVFPFATLFINLSGCFLVALFLSAASGRAGLSEGWRYLFPIGFVGAYTTFSTFEWELSQLGKRGAWGAAALYFIASNALGYGAVVIGTILGRRI